MEYRTIHLLTLRSCPKRNSNAETRDCPWPLIWRTRSRCPKANGSGTSKGHRVRSRLIWQPISSKKRKNRKSMSSYNPSQLFNFTCLRTSKSFWIIRSQPSMRNCSTASTIMRSTTMTVSLRSEHRCRKTQGSTSLACLWLVPNPKWQMNTI